jgi:DNA mismatch repair protein MutS2
MISITQKTLQDLEFETILQTIASRCNTDIGETKALAIAPINDKTELLINLQQTAEYLSSFSNNNVIPNHGFENINY